MSDSFIGTVSTGLFNLHTAEGCTTEMIEQAAVAVLDLEGDATLFSRVRRWNRVRTLERSVVITYGPEYEEDDGFGGSTTGPIPMGETLAKNVVTILQGKEAN